MEPTADASSASSTAACDALREFCSHSCTHSDRRPGGGCDGQALRLSFAPPPARDELSHECALGFTFADEMKVVRQLQHKHQEGKRLVQEIYCARSCARAFPPVSPDTAGDQTQTMKHYMAIFTGMRYTHSTITYFLSIPCILVTERYATDMSFAVLQPQVEKIKALSDYCSQTVVMLSDNIQRITVHENTTRVIPDVLMDALLGVMDVVLQLNQLHDTKSSLRNDFSVFKRAFTHVKAHIHGAEHVEKDIQRLQDFVGNSSQSKGSIWDSLRHNLTNVKRFDQVVYLLLKHCLAHIDEDICLEPDQKFKFIRVLPSLLSVLEESRQNSKSSAIRAAEKKAMEAAVRVLQRFPVVPMFAEMNAMPINAFQAPSNSKSDMFIGENPKHLDPSFDLPAVSARMKHACAEYIPRLVHAITLSAKGISSKEQNAVLYGTVLEGLQYMSDWKSSFLLFTASKYQNPRSNDALRQMGSLLQSPHLEYERVVKYNFIKDEITAMIDAIYCIKSLIQVMRRNELLTVACIQGHIYQRTQSFVQHTILPILHRAHKRKLVCAKILHDVRMVCGDWEDCKSTADDFTKKRKDRRFPEISDRKVAPTLCQIQMLGTLINSIYAKRSMGDLNSKPSAASNLFSFKKDLDSSDVDLLQQFYREANTFPSLLRFDDTLKELGDFSTIWFRELYLEITKCTQFPIDTSLPWLLTENCLLLSSAFGLQPVMSILDIYNDAASCSLYQLSQQVLYDEAEAEGKLCFDQLVFMLADQLYAHYKNEAKSLDSNSKSDLKSDGSFKPTLRSRKVGSQDAHEEKPIYEWLAHVKSVDVLGQSHNLTFLLGQHIHMKIMKDLEKWLFKVESSDIASVLDSQHSLAILKRAHVMLSSIVLLDDFDDMMQDVDAQISMPEEQETAQEISSTSRLQTFASQIVLLDLCQHFSFNAQSWRFVRVPLPIGLQSCAPGHYADADSDEIAKHLNRAHSRADPQLAPSHPGCEASNRSYRGCFGPSHANVFLDLLSERQILDIAGDCTRFVEAKIEDVLELCIPALGSAIPPFRFPRFMYRTEGCYGFFEGKFKHVLDSEELEAHIFHCFREIGNGLCFLLLLSDVADGRSTSETYTASDADDSGLPIVRTGGIFRRSLQRLHGMLHSSGIASEWYAPPSSHPEKMANVSSFYHVWSALEFLSCTTRGDVSIREQFGDGVPFAGCTLIHLLGQRSMYELWNVSQHVLNVHLQEQRKIKPVLKGTRDKKSSAGSTPLGSGGIAQSVGTLGQEMKDKAASFVVNVLELRKSSSNIFHMLETSWSCAAFPRETSSSPPPADQSNVPYRPPAFAPPTTNDLTKQMQQKATTCQDSHETSFTRSSSQ